MPGYNRGSGFDRADPDEIIEAETRQRKRGLPWRFWLALGLVAFILGACLLIGLYVIAWANDPHGTGARVTTFFDTLLTTVTIAVPASVLLAFLFATRTFWMGLLFHPIHARDDRWPAVGNARGRLVMLDNQQPRGRHVHQIVNNYDAPALPAPGETTVDEGQPFKMPVVRFRDIAPRLGRGQMFLGMRPDGTPRFGTWDEYKTVLVLGTGSSGKTTTIAELMGEAVLDDALFVVCDPHATKQDSLTNKIKALTPFLYPGTSIAVQHPACLANARLVRELLEFRVATQYAPDTHDRKIVLVVDEFNRLSRDEQITKELGLICEILGQEGRGYNVFAVVGTQGVIGFAKQRRVFISYIVHSIDKSEARAVGLPEQFAKLAPGLPQGAVFFKDADRMTELLQRALIEAPDLRELAELAPPPRLPVAAWEPRPGYALPPLSGKDGRPLPEEPLLAPLEPLEDTPPTPPPAPVPADIYGGSQIIPIDTRRGGVGGVGGANPSKPRWKPEQYEKFLEMRRAGASITAIRVAISNSSDFIYRVKEMEQYALLAGDLKLETMGEPEDDEDATVRVSEEEARHARGH